MNTYNTWHRNVAKTFPKNIAWQVVRDGPGAFTTRVPSVPQDIPGGQKWRSRDQAGKWDVGCWNADAGAVSTHMIASAQVYLVMNAVDAEMIIGLIYDQKSSPNPLRNTVADVRRQDSLEVEGREAEMKRRVWGHKNKQDHERGGRHLDDLGKAVPQPEHVDCSHTADSLQPGKLMVIFVSGRNLELHDQNFELIYRCSESGDY
ncbi:hypothetical protein BD779DRAFT_1482607 [Infundibulicybe gibba]|nr:hypothetical protein BD779DRAFT_1482607 [Infundibulicybe gibba]